MATRGGEGGDRGWSPLSAKNYYLNTQNVQLQCSPTPPPMYPPLPPPPPNLSRSWKPMQSVRDRGWQGPRGRSPPLECGWQCPRGVLNCECSQGRGWWRHASNAQGWCLWMSSPPPPSGNPVSAPAGAWARTGLRARAWEPRGGGGKGAIAPPTFCLNGTDMLVPPPPKCWQSLGISTSGESKSCKCKWRGPYP